MKPKIKLQIKHPIKFHIKLQIKLLIKLQIIRSYSKSVSKSIFKSISKSIAKSIFMSKQGICLTPFESKLVHQSSKLAKKEAFEAYPCLQDFNLTKHTSISNTPHNSDFISGQDFCLI